MKKTKLKIGFITPAFPTFVCGVGDHIAKLCEELIKLDLEVYVITSKQVKIDTYYQNLGINFYPVIEKWDFVGWQKAYKLSRKLCFDIVHFQYPIRYPGARSFILRFLPFTLPYVWFSLVSGWIPKRVITIHEYYKVSFFAKIKLFLDILFSSNTILVNHADVLRMNKLIIPRKYTYVPIGPTIKMIKNSRETIIKFKNEKKLNSDYILAYFGFIDKTKGFEDLIRALNILKSKHKNIKLLVVGETQSSKYLNQIKETIKELNLERNIIWTGYISEKEVCLYLQASDLVVLPYLSGATSNRSTLLVPLLLESPILSTYVLGITPEKFQKKLALVPPASPEKIALKVEDIKLHPKKNHILKKSARELSSMFNWADIAKRTNDIYYESL